MRLSRGGGAPQSAQHKHSKLLNPQTLQLCAYRGLAFTFERAHNIDPIHRNLSAALAPRLVNSLFVPTAEAAFIAGISDREMNRAIDER
ncbi:MAG TPA: hypothetical protein VGN43_19415, partial [Steroidobacteraceae bacterium]|nr:hypothetical protein [Steroidobacteraceae bacterium]